MQKYRRTVFWIATVLAALVGANSEYGACPYARLLSGYQGLGIPSDLEEPELSYSNSLREYGVQNSPAYTFSSILQKYLADENIDLPYLNSDSLTSSSNSISKCEDPKCASPPETCLNDTLNYYYRRIDGSCNNLQNPGYGMTRARYGRLVPPNYAGINNPTTSKKGLPLPGARSLSLALFGEDNFLDEYRTLASMQWGQIVAHDLSRFSTECAPDDCCEESNNEKCLPIFLHPQGPIALGSDKRCIPFSRAVTDKDANCQIDPYLAEKISTVTAFMDMSSVYGSTEKENEKVRQFSGGLLKTSFINNRQWLPITFNNENECDDEEADKCYNIPDNRNQFIPSIIVMHTILVREHNRIACALNALNPYYSDEQLYQEARKINIAQYQHITYYEWLPVVLGQKYVYANGLAYNVRNGDYVNDYDYNEDPAPLAESATAALRYCHTQVPGFFTLATAYRAINETKRLSDFFGRPENIDFVAKEENFDALILGLLIQYQKHSDENINAELKHYFNRKPTEKFGSDLKSFDIQRGRDFGLASYNDVRQYCGLSRAYVWADFLREIPLSKVEALKEWYDSPDDVELNVAAALETLLPESVFGPTFQCILTKQFLRSRISDRFFYENENGYSGFTRAQLAEIRKSSMSGLLCNNADYLRSLQPNAFIVPNPNNVEKSCDNIPQLNLQQWQAGQQQQAYY